MKSWWIRLKTSPAPRREEGIALVIALLILIMLTVVGLVAIISSSTESTIAINARGSTQALYLAEAGVAQACWWFNRPSTFTLSGFFNNGYSGTADKFFKEREQLNTSYYVAGSTGTTQFQGHYVEGAITADLYINNETTLAGIFGNLSGYGKITELAVFRPSDGSDNICTIRVKAVSRTGGERIIEQELAPNRIPGLNAPLQSGLGADWNGNGTVHWGEVLIEGNADLQHNLNQVPYNYKNGSLNPLNPDFDRWFQARIKGTYSGQDPSGSTPYSTTCRSNPDGAYSPVCHNNLKQNDSTVSIQRWDYQTLKNSAQSQGYYYVADSGGNIHKGSLAGPVVPIDYFFANAGFGFVDNPQQRDPATLSPGDAITITKSGNTDISGTFYVAGNLDIRGLGGGSGVNATAPPNPLCVSDASGPCDKNTYTSGDATRDSVNLSGVQIRGALYTTGSMNFQGNPTIYGALVSEGGFGSGGNPQIWYDWDLRIRPTGLPPTVKRVWREVRTQE